MKIICSNEEMELVKKMLLAVGKDTSELDATAERKGEVLKSEADLKAEVATEISKKETIKEEEVKKP